MGNSDPKPPSLFDAEKAQAAKEEGMERGGRSMTLVQHKAWMDLIHEVAKSKPLFSTEDVVKLGVARGVEEPRTGQSFGNLMKAAAKLGWCWKTNMTIKSDRVSLHRGICQVWASNISAEIASTCKHCEGDGLTVGPRP